MVSVALGLGSLRLTHKHILDPQTNPIKHTGKHRFRWFGDVHRFMLKQKSFSCSNKNLFFSLFLSFFFLMLVLDGRAIFIIFPFLSPKKAWYKDQTTLEP